ncbi:SMC-Scp complex subunit ScpB [Patescibacteria group bacterium]|nr:SMC-Scp complex subunit ScpB [Patescibacteria group bacterium]
MGTKDSKLKSAIESLLFIANRPLTKKELSKIIGQKVKDIEEVLKELIDEYSGKNGGVKIIQNGQEFQMVTNPANSSIIQKFLKEEVNRELTPASLETLSIIAYRGPIKRDELEQIRGVNCSIILRHLLIKGLIIEEPSSGKASAGKDSDKQIYNVSLDFIRHLGINNLKELPDYERLNQEVPLSSLIDEEE